MSNILDPYNYLTEQKVDEAASALKTLCLELASVEKELQKGYKEVERTKSEAYKAESNIRILRQKRVELTKQISKAAKGTYGSEKEVLDFIVKACSSVSEFKSIKVRTGVIKVVLKSKARSMSGEEMVKAKIENKIRKQGLTVNIEAGSGNSYSETDKYTATITKQALKGLGL